MKILARLLALAMLALAVASGPALGQDRRGRADGWGERRMDPQERQRMREDVRDAYRERGERSRGGRAERPFTMSPAEREKLRRDIESANRELRRK